jgi:AAA15 family ATPase/GTPase
MLKELHISNYRLFDDLILSELGQVNLIAGKNNTGKTALLEALRIWAAKGDNTVVNHALKMRGQFIVANYQSYDNLFPRKSLLRLSEIIIKINKLQIVRGINSNKIPHFRVFWVTTTHDNLNPNVTSDQPQDKSIFVPFVNVYFPLESLWESIVLTPLEDDVIEFLKIVEPRIRRMDVNGENSRVLLDGETAPVSLKSLGEGMSRMLWLAVALVSAKESKLLLIDEFEAGLHHSVQKTLWEKIFQYAKEWDIQVFVTTHSMDTVRTFQEVADKAENLGLGKYFRLQRNQKDQIEAVSYNEEELATALEFELETR